MQACALAQNRAGWTQVCGDGSDCSGVAPAGTLQGALDALPVGSDLDAGRARQTSQPRVNATSERRTLAMSISRNSPQVSMATHLGTQGPGLQGEEVLARVGGRATARRLYGEEVPDFSVNGAGGRSEERTAPPRRKAGLTRG